MKKFIPIVCALLLSQSLAYADNIVTTAGDITESSLNAVLKKAFNASSAKLQEWSPSKSLAIYLDPDNEEINVEFLLDNKHTVTCTLKSTLQELTMDMDDFLATIYPSNPYVSPSTDLSIVTHSSSKSKPQLRGPHDVELVGCKSETAILPKGDIFLRVNYVANPNYYGGSQNIAEFGGLETVPFILGQYKAKNPAAVSAAEQQYEGNHPAANAN